MKFTGEKPCLISWEVYIVVRRKEGVLGNAKTALTDGFSTRSTHGR
jgi:hypothetical protein